LDRRGEQQGRGLAVYVKQGISCSYLSQFTHSDVASSQSHFKPKCKKKFQFPVFLVANIRGGLTTKLDELQLLFISNDVDICVISETWLRDGINSDILQIADYSLFRLDRRGEQQGRGLAVYVKQGISCSYLSQFTHNELEVLWLL